MLLILGKTSLLAEKFGLARDDWNGFNILQRAASRVGGLDLGFRPNNDSSLDSLGILDAASTGKLDVLYLLRGG